MFYYPELFKSEAITQILDYQLFMCYFFLSMFSFLQTTLIFRKIIYENEKDTIRIDDKKSKSFRDLLFSILLQYTRNRKENYQGKIK